MLPHKLVAHRHKSVSTLRDWIEARRLSDKPKGWCRHSIPPPFSGHPASAQMPPSPGVANHLLLPAEPAQLVFSGPACLPASSIRSHALCTPVPMHTPITAVSPSHPNCPLSSSAKPRSEPLKEDEPLESKQCLGQIKTHKHLLTKCIMG